MPLVQLVYASRPFGFDQATLSNLLLDSRRANVRDNITGALFARHDLYLQLLEGPDQKVEAVYRRICQRRSKTRPKGGAKVGHFGVGREGRIECWRPVDRAPQIAGG
ncbi:MAG: BLUF domain-containing protein [Roseovarius sp.]|nr:BLUF domain-containing protein [Roseovarius sp.]